MATRKTLQLDYLSAKQIGSRNADNTIAAVGSVLRADGLGNSSWEPNTTTAVNAFTAVAVNSPITHTLYANGSERLGNTLKIVASDPIQLTALESKNQLAIGINTSTFLTETTKRNPTEDFKETDGTNFIDIDCQYKTYKLLFYRRAHYISFNKQAIPAGKVCTIRLFIQIDTSLGSSAPSIIWSNATVRLPAYSPSTENGKIDIIELTSFDKGETWVGAILCQGI